MGAGFDVGDGGRSGLQLLSGSEQPGSLELGIGPLGLEGEDAFDPIREFPGGSQESRHGRVIEVAVGIDQAREHGHIAQIGDRARGDLPDLPDLRPGTHRTDLMSGNPNRAVGDRRRGHRNHGSGSQDQGIRRARRDGVPSGGPPACGSWP